MKLLIRLWRSSAGKKAIAALTGLILVGWLIAHISGNLLAFSGRTAIDGYASALRKAPVLLWAVRLTLALAFGLHVASVTALFRQARAARGERHPQRTRAATLASRGMRVGGALLLVFVVLHVAHMTFGVAHPSYAALEVYDNLVTGLQSPLVASAYIFAASLVGLHLLHGLWAAPQSLGLSTQTRRWALWLSIGIALGFASVPLAVLAGVLR